MNPSNGRTDATRPALPRSLVAGVYVPTPAIFHDNNQESIDYETTTQHSVRLAHAGVTGICVHGSNGEAVHLTLDERKQLIIQTRQALTGNGFPHMPIIVGTGAQSTQTTIELCLMAKACDADAVLVLPPSYYKTLFDGDAALIRFYNEVADVCAPMPVILYNFPGGANGLDLSSDVMVELAHHPNIVGVKFTCGNTGKLGRVAAATRCDTDAPGTETFLCFAGSGDFLLPALAVGASGVIGGIANLAPRAVVRMFEAYRDGRREEAERIQKVVARGDWIMIQWGVVGVKRALQVFARYGGWARRPLPRPNESQTAHIAEGLHELMDLEESLASQHTSESSLRHPPMPSSE